MDKGAERRKRKVEDDEDEETEEEKMEKFFALVKSTREGRVGGVDRAKESKDQFKKTDDDEEKARRMHMPAASGWCPMFQPEDFMINSNGFPAPAMQTAGPSTTTTNTTTTDDDDDQNKREILVKDADGILNLNLSL